MRGKGLVEARKLYRARKFPEVIRVLEPEVFRFRESAEYFLLLGLSCLRTQDSGGASSYLGRARQLSPKSTPAALGLAAIALKRAETEKALNLWLEVLEHEPSNSTARRGMNLIRKGITPEEIQTLSDSGKIERVFPPLQAKVTPAVVLIPILTALIAGGVIFLGSRIIQTRAPVRAGVSGIELPPSMLIDTGAAGSIVMTEREVSRAFDQAKNYLLSYRDNLAAVQLNRILLSNAAGPVKERARALKGVLSRPSFTTLKDGFSYTEVAKEPGLYDGASVRWSGLVANLVVTKESMKFELLVGYAEQKELQGIVPVTLTFAADIRNGMALDLLAQVVLDNGRLALSGISVHQLVSP